MHSHYMSAHKYKKIMVKFHPCPVVVGRVVGAPVNILSHVTIPKLTQPSTFLAIAKCVWAFGFINGDGKSSTTTASLVDLRFKLIGLVQRLATTRHFSVFISEPDELLQCTDQCHSDNTTNVVMTITINAICLKNRCTHNTVSFFPGQQYELKDCK